MFHDLEHRRRGGCTDRRRSEQRGLSGRELDWLLLQHVSRHACDDDDGRVRRRTHVWRKERLREGNVMPPPLPFSQGSAWTTLRQEAKRMWPFAMGFAVTSILYTKVALGITDEDIKNSKFANPHGHHHH